MTTTSSPDSEVYQLALQAAPSGIMVAGNRGEIHYVNQALADMFGYRTEDLLGKPVEILIPDQFVAAHRRHVEKYANSQQPCEMGTGRDLEGMTKDGRRFSVEIGLRPAQTSFGRVVVATVIDITERKAIEERLHQHEEQLEKLVADRTQALMDAQREKERVMEHLIQAEKMTAVGTLVSGIGHEINNPLYVLFATAEALANEENIAECRAYGDEIQQVLFNIVRNATQSIDGKGRVEINTVDDGDWVSINIQDNGSGISNDHLKRVFDPFFTTKGPDQGEGLGLYIVRQIVTRYQGTIDAENTASGGTRFVIRFPIADRVITEEEQL